MTVAVSSEDGQYTATMNLVPPALPTGSEDSASDARRDLFMGQMETTLNETLDRLCQSPN